METITFGRTGAVVSRLGFGGAPAGLTNYLGEYRPQDDTQRRQVIGAIERALELGITYFDTAPGYGKGAGEALFGEALAGVSQDIFLATKVTPVDPTDEAPAVAVRRSVEESLTRLRRDQVDLVQLHGTTYSATQADQMLGPGGMVEALETLRDEGLLRFIGFTSEDNNPPVYRFIESGRFDVMQIAYNLLFQHPHEMTRPFGTLLEADRAGMGTCTMRTLTSGLFQKWVQWVNPENTFDYTPALLQFVLSNPIVDVALVGMRSAAEVEKNVTIAESQEGRVDLDALHNKYIA